MLNTLCCVCLLLFKVNDLLYINSSNIRGLLKNRCTGNSVGEGKKKKKHIDMISNGKTSENASGIDHGCVRKQKNAGNVGKVGPNPMLASLPCLLRSLHLIIDVSFAPYDIPQYCALHSVTVKIKIKI